MTDKYDDIRIDCIEKKIFLRFPDLKPACSDNYWKDEWHKKLMIICSHNYFEEETDSVFKDEDGEKWYKSEEDTEKLIPTKKKNLVNNYKSNYPPFNKILDSMKAVANFEGNIYDEAMFYNYFLRPAVKNKPFKPSDLDRKVAREALCKIIKLAKPNIVIFVSKKAYDDFMPYINKNNENINMKEIVLNFAYYPVRHWWNTPNGKQKFEKLLKEYWLK